MQRLKYPFIFFLLLFFFGGRPIEFGEEKTFFHGYSIVRPVIRVAIGRNLDEVRIKASSGMKIYEVNSQYRLLADDASEILLRGQKIKLSEKFLVQVAQANDRNEAEKIARSINLKVPGRINIAEEVDRLRSRRIYSVRYGDFLTRGEALSFLKSLNQAGFEEAWIVREEVAAAEKNSFWALLGDEIIHFPERTTLYLVPAHEWSYLSFNDRRYRGMFILRADRTGLMVINVLNVEDYLKGVVPMELSPGRFGELEALKAQAVAARTYALRNLGLNEAEGFDLTDTPDHQVYGGMDAESALSTRAVEETRGEALFYRGQLINALYTSTCGGMTEEGKEVFGGPDLSYLRAVECAEEKLSEYRVTTTRPAIHLSLGQRPITHEMALLVGLGIVPSNLALNSLTEPVAPNEASTWIQAVISYLKLKNQPVPPPSGPITSVVFARWLLDSLGWKERCQNLLLQSEADFLLRDFPGIAEKDRRPLAYLVREGYLPATPEFMRADRAMTRGEILFLLARVIKKEKDPLRSGKFRGMSGHDLRIETREETITLSLAPEVFLFRVLEGEVSPASSLTFFGGEDVLFLEKEGLISLLEVCYPAATNVLDRSSAYSSWQVRLSRGDLSRRLNEYFPVGELVDLRVVRRGRSHRVLELEIIGESGRALVHGLRVRWVLGLRETLFTIDREWEENGKVAYFIFTGRGWGHGVGLCQVGAYGLAQRGASYREILNKYYPGTKIGKIY